MTQTLSNKTTLLALRELSRLEESMLSAAALAHPGATHLLDIEAGAGHLTLKLLPLLPETNCTLIERSSPLLERAKERVGSVAGGVVELIHGHIRNVRLPADRFDIAIAGSGLRYLHANEWEDALRRIYLTLKPGGTFWCIDMVNPTSPLIGSLLRKSLPGCAASPNLLERAGFTTVEVLYQSARFITLVACKG